MNKRDIFLPSLSTLIISGMMVFYSCAHQNRAQDELDVAADEETAAQTAENEAKDAASTATETASNDIDMTQMGIDEASQTAENVEKKADEVKTEANGAAQDVNTKIEDDLANLGMDGDPTVAANNELPADPLEELNGATATAQGSEQKDAFKLAQEEAKSSESLDAAPAKHTPSKKSFAGGSQKVPKIPAKPVVKNGVPLNRFYFIRQGDTPESVSEMIYGSASHAKDLQKWNAHAWGPGSIVYYSSPSNPKDNQIGSYYRENGVEAEEYTVGKGDWISKVAYKKLGHPESWKEIAVINGMSRPDKIEVGQRIAIYPKDLSRVGGQNLADSTPQSKPVLAKPSIPQLAPVQPEQSAPVAQVPPQHIPEDVQNAASQALQPTAPVAQAPQAEAPKPVAKPKPQPVDSSKLLEQNLPAAVILAGVLILSALYLAVRRRKMSKQQSEEFEETPSSKSNRR